MTLATIGATYTAPRWVNLTVLGAAVTALAFYAVHAAVRRREELAADLFAIDLTGDLRAAAELLRFARTHAEPT